MKARKPLTLVTVLLVVGALVSVSPAVAKKTPFDFWEVSCLVSDGQAWIEGGVMHNRGRVTTAVLYAYDDQASEVVIVGSDTVIGNADIDLASGDAGVFGVFTLTYLPAPGSAAGTYDGTWDGTFNLYSGVFSGRAVAKGTGDLRHQKMRMRLTSDEVPAWLTEYLAANPLDCEVSGIGHDTGFINHRNR